MLFSEIEIRGAEIELKIDFDDDLDFDFLSKLSVVTIF